MRGSILVVERDPETCAWLQRELSERGYWVRALTDVGTALATLEVEPVDLVLLDTATDREGWADLLEQLTQGHAALSVIVTSSSADVRMAVEAMRRGAFDYLQKPLDVAELEVVLERALGVARMHQELQVLRREQRRFQGLIGTGPAMAAVFAVIEKLARSPSTTVLIMGESGTGKELVARAIHTASGGPERPFVAVNCTAMPETLLESELFGHERGSFTDARDRKIGLFEVANGGTIFLDEIADMDLRVQGKLLRALEERSIRRVGGTRPIRVNVRVIAATNKNLEEMVRRGLFRADLYYRLCVVPIHLPPLRERREDIPLLAQQFVQEFNRQFGKQIEGFTPRAMQVLMEYHWPGNIRELRNVIERIVLLEDCRTIDVVNLPQELVRSRRVAVALPAPELSFPGSSYREAKRKALRQFERSFLVQLLRATDGNVSRAAAAAGMPRGSLQRLLRRHGLNTQEFRPGSNGR
jgi:two-component system response regulator AtoC